MEEEQRPATVPPEGFQAHQGIIAPLRPKLARPVEPALVLFAGRFHRPAAAGFTALFDATIVQPSAIVFQAVPLGLPHRPPGAPQFFQRLIQLCDDLHRPAGQQFVLQRSDPSRCGRGIRGMQRLGHRP